MLDFILMEKNKPIQFIECKLRHKEINPALRYLKQRFPDANAAQIALYGEEDYINKDGIHVCPAEKYLDNLI